MTDVQDWAALFYGKTHKCFHISERKENGTRMKPFFTHSGFLKKVSKATNEIEWNQLLALSSLLLFAALHTKLHKICHFYSTFLPFFSHLFPSIWLGWFVEVKEIVKQAKKKRQQTSRVQIIREKGCPSAHTHTRPRCEKCYFSVKIKNTNQVAVWNKYAQLQEKEKKVTKAPAHKKKVKRKSKVKWSC